MMQEEEEKDRISDLPEEIINIIFSFLSLKDAVAIGKLSTKFRHRWKSCKLKSMKLINYDYNSPLEFLEWVNDVMDQYQGPEVVELSIDNWGHPDEDISRWISFAAAKNVNTFNLSLPLREICLPSISDLPLPCFENVVLSGCYLSASSSPIFVSVKSLSLTNVHDISKDDFESIFTICTSLEELHLVNVPLPSARIAGPSLKLKCLDIFSPYRNYDRALEVNAPELRVLIYRGPNRLRIEGTSKLVEVDLSLSAKKKFYYALSVLQNQLSLVEILTLTASPKQVEKSDIPILQNLKVLTLKLGVPTENLLSFARILKASPVLREFIMHVTHFNGKEEPYRNYEAIERLDDKCTYSCLEEVYFSGFTCYKNEYRLLLYLLETCSSLRKITLNPWRRYENSWRMAHTKHKLQLIRDNATQFGYDYVPSNIEFVVL